MGIGLYIHIPFCRQKCLYCDFPSEAADKSRQERYVEALCRQVRQQGQRLAHEPVETVYIGGGTPTILEDAQLERIVRTVGTCFRLEPAAEFTIEANPGTVTRAKLELLRSLGLNRLSFGVQSFNDDLLRTIGRIHTAAEARAAIAQAKACGFRNISLDLMYGLPGQDLADLECSVKQALAQEVQHISIYGLQVETGTPFAARQDRGELQLPDEEDVEQMYDYICRTLPAAGYERYEISNFAHPGFASRHNLRYWQDGSYIGLGAAAHSYYGNRRFANLAGVDAYSAAIVAGRSVADEEEEMTQAILMEEFCFLALRTKWGIDPAAFAEKFGCELREIYGEKILHMQQQGLLQVEDASLRLTERGMKYGNVVFAEFLLER